LGVDVWVGGAEWAKGMGDIYLEERSEDFYPTERSEGVVHPTERSEGVVYPLQRSEDVYAAEPSEGVVVKCLQSND
jgi:hypothetical protein